MRTLRTRIFFILKRKRDDRGVKNFFLQSLKTSFFPTMKQKKTVKKHSAQKKLGTIQSKAESFESYSYDAYACAVITHILGISRASAAVACELFNMHRRSHRSHYFSSCHKNSFQSQCFHNQFLIINTLSWKIDFMFKTCVMNFSSSLRFELIQSNKKFDVPFSKPLKIDKLWETDKKF